MDQNNKKLIEVALPLDLINQACNDDKSRKTGHIRNLHKWFAPMPLPAWRAILAASLIDAPTDESDQEANSKIESLFRLLERVLPLDAAKHPELFGPLRELLKSASEEIPIVMDPFCGGGSTILEAQRLGFRTIGSDLNPVPVLITTVLTKYPSLFSDVLAVNPESRSMPRMTAGTSGLVEDVRYYAGVIGRRSHMELESLYPKLEIFRDGRLQQVKVISWIWSRAIQCPNPGCGIETPLASSLELTRVGKNRNDAYWIEPTVIGSGLGKTVEYRVGMGSGPAPSAPKIGRGANFKCVACSTVINGQQIMSETRTKQLRTVLMAIVAKTEGGERIYLSPTTDVVTADFSPQVDWVPNLALATHPQYMGAPRYGLKTVADLFTVRQLKLMNTFAENVRTIRKEIEEEAKPTIGDRATSYADAIVTILALCVTKMAQSNNVLVRWKIDSRNGSGGSLPAFDTQTIPMVWDFAENNPFGGSTGDWIESVVPTALRAFDFVVYDGFPAEIFQQDARSAFEIGTGPILVATDPPYYDNVPYADLSDVFYPFLRYILHDVHDGMFKTIQSPKSDELVADYHRMGGSREKAENYFLEGFKETFIGLRSRIKSNIPMTVVYSFKQVEKSNKDTGRSTGWEVMLSALLESGFAVTATWPIRTTMQNRSRDINSNALASAIAIVCKPRDESIGNTTRRNFVNELNQALPSVIRQLQNSGIAPVDLQQSIVGPGMAVFSKYSAVLEASGTAMSVREALALINQTLQEILIEGEGDFDPETRWAMVWFEQTGFDEGQFGVAETLSKAKNTSVEGMSAAGILASTRGKVHLLSPEELPKTWDPQSDRRFTIWESLHHLVRVLQNGGESAAAELQTRIGPTDAETARELAYRLYTICERKGWAKEAHWYNSLVQSWPEITRLARTNQPAEQGPLI